MSLPLPAIERVFSRLAATYGAEFARRWEGVDAAAVKSVWAHELSGFADNLQPIAWALSNLTERCPNAIEFRNLCRRAPADPVAPLPAPAADPARVAAELAKLGHVRRRPADAAWLDGKAWARRLQAGERAGDRLSTIQRLFWRQALGVPADAAA